MFILMINDDGTPGRMQEIEYDHVSTARDILGECCIAYDVDEIEEWQDESEPFTFNGGKLWCVDVG